MFVLNIYVNILFLFFKIYKYAIDKIIEKFDMCFFYIFES